MVLGKNYKKLKRVGHHRDTAGPPVGSPHSIFASCVVAGQILYSHHHLAGAPPVSTNFLHSSNILQPLLYQFFSFHSTSSFLAPTWILLHTWHIVVVTRGMRAIVELYHMDPAMSPTRSTFFHMAAMWPCHIAYFFVVMAAKSSIFL